MKKGRIKSAILIIGIAVAVNAVLASILALISASPDKSFIDVFQRGFSICFVWFGGSFVVAALLMLLTNMPEDKTLSYGAGFYYGTAACLYVLTEYFWMDDSGLTLGISAVIAGLICYIFWLKNK